MDKRQKRIEKEEGCWVGEEKRGEGMRRDGKGRQGRGQKRNGENSGKSWNREEEGSMWRKEMRERRLIGEYGEKGGRRQFEGG